jgi:hypothetical protein
MAREFRKRGRSDATFGAILGIATAGRRLKQLPSINSVEVGA